LGWQNKKLQMQGAQILRSEAYIEVHRNNEGCSATPQMDFLRSHQSLQGQYITDRLKFDALAVPGLTLLSCLAPFQNV